VPPYDVLVDLKQVYLEDSIVLDLCILPGRVELRCDVVLCEGHPSYHPRLAGEQYCYGSGRLIFDGVAEVSWQMAMTQPPRSPTGGVEDYGNIDVFTVDGDAYELLGGDFGRLHIRARSFALMLDAAAP
jgi:hypothetical protein